MARLANRKKYKKKRETFMQFYNRTCDRVFGYVFERCLNHADTMIVCREAFIDMYFDISSLRSAPSVDYWQRKQVDKTLRYLVRKDRLSMIHEKTLADVPDSITVDEKEELWRRINRTIDIDPWRLVPVPGKSSIFTVIADQAASDMSYMSMLDIAKAAGVVLLIVALIGGAGFGAGFFLQSGRIIWASGAGTSALSTAFSAWRSDRKIDVKLAAEIYTRAVIGGTLDLAFGKAFSGVRTAVKPTPFTEMRALESIRINVSPEVARTLDSGTGNWDVLTWGGNKIQTIKYSGELDSRIRAYLEETQKVKLPEKLTIINDFTHGEESLRQTIQLPRGIWVERESEILAGVHRYPKLESFFKLWDNFYFNVGRTATLPSVGDASTRWVIDKDKWGIITDTFYIPEVKQSKKSP